MSVTLNAYQSEELKRVLAKLAEDDAEAKEFGERELGAVHLEWFPCERIPGMVAVHAGGSVYVLLYPSPRPIPGDPLFQHADPILTHWKIQKVMAMMHSIPEMRKDWQWDGFSLDAVNTMPAGACAYFEHYDDIYGAYQLEVHRDE